MSFAAVEAAINEFWDNVRNNYGRDIQNLDSRMKEHLLAVSDDILDYDSKTLQKYQLALIASRKSVFNKGEAPYQDVELLRKLRNRSIHFKPEIITISPDTQNALTDGHDKLIRGIWVKVKPCQNRILREKGRHLIFPDKILGYGCAKWAVESSIDFVDEFFKRMGIPSVFEPVREQLSLPECPS
jgi:hypothetical protein